MLPHEQKGTMKFVLGLAVAVTLGGCVRISVDFPRAIISEICKKI